MSTIISSSPLLQFAQGKRMQVGAFVNKTDGTSFKSCIFTDAQNNKCFVAFSSNLGELTPAEISANKHILQVVTMDSGSRILCKQGEKVWEDVVL